MNLVVIEGDFHERQWMVVELKRFFPSAYITEFKTAGDFLLALGTLPTADVIITEHFLPLGQVRPDYDEWFGKLDSLFPEVTANWDHQEAAERLVRYMRKAGVQTPVIIYTHSDNRFINADILRDPHVVYCIKLSEMINLTTIIKELCM